MLLHLLFSLSSKIGKHQALYLQPDSVPPTWLVSLGCVETHRAQVPGSPPRLPAMLTSGSSPPATGS